VTVLGSSCSIPRPGRACSSYLLQYAGTTVLADLGTGAFSNLLAHGSLATLDAVIVSHMHADHFLDIVPMRYALKYGNARGSGKVVVYLPPGGEALLRHLTGAFHRESSEDFLGEVFELRTYDPRATLAIGELSVRFAPTHHYIATYAMRFEAGGRSVTYSADTAPEDRVTELARETNLFICEATLAPGAETELPLGHSSARQAAQMAAAAGVERLLLTHYPVTIDAALMAAEARERFSGQLHVVDDGFSYTV
jgi:ribonuclease BN (tRNA processing enzyme)